MKGSIMASIVGVCLANGGSRDRDIEIGAYCTIESVDLKKDTKITTSFFPLGRIRDLMSKNGQDIPEKIEDIFWNMKKGKSVNIVYSDLAGIDFAHFSPGNNGEIILSHATG